MHPVPLYCLALPEKVTINNMLTWLWQGGPTVPCQTFSRSGLLHLGADATSLDVHAILTVHLLHRCTAPAD